MTHSYLSTCECSHQTHVGHGHVDIPRHAQSVMGPECSNYLEGSELCNIANGHPINSAQRVLNNTEVKERNTICRHACFGVYASSVQLCNTSRHVTHSYLSTCECSHQTHVGHGHVDIPRHAQSVMGPECSNYHEGSELCNIANGHGIYICILYFSRPHFPAPPLCTLLNFLSSRSVIKIEKTEKTAGYAG